MRTGRGTAHAIWSGGGFRAALVAWSDVPDWPHGFGEPASIVELLAGFGPWKSVCVAITCAEAVAEALAERTGCRISRVPELFYRLDRPPRGHGESPARHLGPEDSRLLARTAHELEPPASLLAQHPAAGVVVNDRVVALAWNGASSSRYADISVATMSEFRGRGYATACGCLVAQRVRESGRTPVWCTGADNVASQRTAAAIGFEPAAQRQNLF